MRAAPFSADGIDTITIADHDLKRLRFIEDARPNARVPMPGLLEARDVIDERGCRVQVETPFGFLIKWEQVIAAQQHELPSAEFLVIVTGQGERIFRNQWEQRSHSVRAEPVCVDTGARGEAEEETMF